MMTECDETNFCQDVMTQKDENKWWQKVIKSKQSVYTNWYEWWHNLMTQRDDTK